MGENKFRILEKASPILHSSFIIHHSSFSLSPLLLNSFVLHFFKPLNSYENLMFRHWKMFSVICCSILGVFCGAVFGCFNFTHEWSRVCASAPKSEIAVLALTDALHRLRVLFDDRVAARQPASSARAIAFAFVGWEKGEAAEASPAQAKAIAEALSTSWPNGQFVFLPGSLLKQGDIDSLTAFAASASTPFTASIVVLENSTEQISLLDLVFSQWILVRDILRENAKLAVKVVDRKGEVVLFETLEVSPTVVHDTMISPSGCFTTFLEARTEKPNIVDFGELFQGVASLSLGSRDEKLRLPNFSESIPMAAPRKN